MDFFKKKIVKCLVSLIMFISITFTIFSLVFVLLMRTKFSQEEISNASTRTYYDTYAFTSNFEQEFCDMTYEFATYIKLRTLYENFDKTRKGIVKVKENDSKKVINYQYNDLEEIMSNEYYNIDAEVEEISNESTEMQDKIDKITYDEKIIAESDEKNTNDVKGRYVKIDTSNAIFLKVERKTLIELIEKYGKINYNSETGTFIDTELEADAYIYRYIMNTEKHYLAYCPSEDNFKTTNTKNIGYMNLNDGAYYVISDVNERLSDTDILSRNIYTLSGISTSIVNEYNMYTESVGYLKNKEKNRGIYYTFIDNKGNTLYSNGKTADEMKQLEYNAYVNFEKGNYKKSDNLVIQSRMSETASYLEDIGEKTTGNMYVGFDNEIEKEGQNYFDMVLYDFAGEFDTAIILAVCSFIIAFIAMIAYISVTKKDKRNIICTVIDNIWIEVVIVIVTVCIGSASLIFMYMSEEYINRGYRIGIIITTVMILYVISYVVCSSAFFSTVRRIKDKTLIKETILYKFFYKIYKGIQSIVRGGKTVVVNVGLMVVLLFFNIYCMMSMLYYRNMIGGFVVLAMIGADIIAVVYVYHKAVNLKTIIDGTKKMADGEIDYVIDYRYINTTEEKMLAETINNVGVGLNKAVKESIKSAEKSINDERLKAELITNVSHDIKTPLTSIINYVDLLKKENVESETVKHYLEILDKKSQRLKMLTEDLVEASKITTGNIELINTQLDFKELVKQAIGEFEDKFKQKDLEIVSKFTIRKSVIYADGRRTFRVVDNLLQNVFKYSMPGTRVYIELEKSHKDIKLSIKNISASPLNIDVNELKERFTRGDESRTTEGSGLGLSIADSLVTLQKGKLVLDIDGDMFKAMIIFKEYEPENKVNLEKEQKEQL